MSCRYCDVWQEARQRRWLPQVGGKRISERFCRTKADWVLRLDKACDELILAKYFHCDLRQHSVAVIACISAKETNRTIHCNSLCAQYQNLLGFCRGVNLFLLHGETSQKARNFKPKLKLREGANDS